MENENAKVLWVAVFRLIVALLSWVFLAPLSFIIPKTASRVVVIGRDNGLFTDNAKHFYLYLVKQPACDCIFLTLDVECYKSLTHSGLPVLWHPSVQSFWYLLTAQIIVMDSAEWTHHGIYQAGINSKLVQLWHGAPLKQIEIPLYLKRKSELPWLFALIIGLQKAVIGRYPKFDIVISTSTFITQEAFKKAFKSKFIIDSGYPRNDAMLNGWMEKRDKDSPAWINTDRASMEAIQRAGEKGYKIVLYAPTFRKHMQSPFTSDVLDINSLSAFAKKQRLWIVIKLHPTMSRRIPKINAPNLSFYDATADIYPVLAFFDCLITDYSSLFFDFLLLDKPIIFFCYDLEQYKNEDRHLLFDFDVMAPGSKCFNQCELETALKRALIQSIDDYSVARQKVRALTFKYHDDKSSERIWKCMTEYSIP